MKDINQQKRENWKSRLAYNWADQETRFKIAEEEILGFLQTKNMMGTGVWITPEAKEFYEKLEKIFSEVIKNNQYCDFCGKLDKDCNCNI